MKTKNCLQAILVLTLTSSVFVNAAQVNLERLRSLENDVNKSEKISTIKKSAAIAAGALTGVAAFGGGTYFCYSKNEELKKVQKDNATSRIELETARKVLQDIKKSLGEPEGANADLLKQVVLRLAEIELLKKEVGQKESDLSEVQNETAMLFQEHADSLIANGELQRELDQLRKQLDAIGGAEAAAAEVPAED